MTGRLKVYDADTGQWVYVDAGVLPPSFMGQGATASQAGVTTTVDLTGSSVTFTAIAGHTYKIDFGANALSTVATDVCNVQLVEAAGALSAFSIDFAAASRPNSSFKSYIAAGLSAGNHTFKLQALRANGTGSITVSGATIVVTDLG